MEANGEKQKAKSMLRPPTKFIKPLQHISQLGCSETSDMNTTQTIGAEESLATDLVLGNRVCVGEAKCGILRYYGTTLFAAGQWCGVQLDEPSGKNDGLVDGHRYFTCEPKFGIFAPCSKVRPIVLSKQSEDDKPTAPPPVISRLAQMSGLYQPKDGRYRERALDSIGSDTAGDTGGDTASDSDISMKRPIHKSRLVKPRLVSKIHVARIKPMAESTPHKPTKFTTINMNIGQVSGQNQDLLKLKNSSVPTNPVSSLPVSSHNATFTMDETQDNNKTFELGVNKGNSSQFRTVAEDVANSTFKINNCAPDITDSRQGMNLTFDTKTGSVAGQLSSNMPDLLTPSALVDAMAMINIQDEINDDASSSTADLDYSLQFLKGTELVSEARQQGVLSDDELNETSLLPPGVVMSDQSCGDYAEQDNSDDDLLSCFQKLDIDSKHNMPNETFEVGDNGYDKLPETSEIPNDKNIAVIDNALSNIADMDHKVIANTCDTIREATSSMVHKKYNCNETYVEDECVVEDDTVNDFNDIKLHHMGINSLDTVVKVEECAEHDKLPVKDISQSEHCSILQLSNMDSVFDKDQLTDQLITDQNDDQMEIHVGSRTFDKAKVVPNLEETVDNVRERPNSVTSINSCDTGYNADTDTEAEDDSVRTLDHVSADVFRNFQKAVMKGTEQASSPTQVDSECDVTSDVGTIQASSDRDTDRDLTSDDSTTDDQLDTECQDVGKDITPTNDVELDLKPVDNSCHKLDDTVVSCEEDNVIKDVDSGTPGETKGCIPNGSVEYQLVINGYHGNTEIGQGDADNSTHVVEINQMNNNNIKEQKPVDITITTITSTKTAKLIPPSNNGVAEEISISKMVKNVTNKKKANMTSANETKKTPPKSPRASSRSSTEEPKKIIKRTPPKSKWDNVMSQIGKETPKTKPTEVKSKLGIHTTSKVSPRSKEGTPSKDNVKSSEGIPERLRKEATPAKDKSPYKPLDLKKKAVIQPKTAPVLPDYSRVRSKLETHTSVPLRKKPANKRSGELVHGPGTGSEASRPSSACSTRSDTVDTKRGRQASVTVSNARRARLVSRSSVTSDISQVSNISQYGSSVTPETPTQKKPATPRVSQLKATPMAKTEARKPSTGSSFNDSSIVSAASKMAPKSSKKNTSPSMATSTPKRSQITNPRTRLKGTGSPQKVTGHQPDLVPKGGRSHAAQEISRLEALCETRTKELNLMKIQLKSGNLGYEAMVVFAQYLVEQLDAFECPSIKKELLSVQKELTTAHNNIGDLNTKKGHLENEIVSLTKKYETEVKERSEQNKTEKKDLIERMTKEKEDEVKRVVDQHSHEVNTLKNYLQQEKFNIKREYETKVTDIEGRYDQEIRDLGTRHDQFVKDIQDEQDSKVHEMQTRFEDIKCSLSGKIEEMRLECEQTRQRYEDALQRDTDYKVQVALAPYKDLPQEIESLKTILEFKNNEIHELRKQKFDFKKQNDELLEAKEKINNLQQKAENLDAILDIKTDYEKQLSQKQQQLLRKLDKESKANKRLSMDKEELQWRLSQSDLSSPDFSASSFGGSFSRQFSRSPSNSEPGTPDARRRRSPVGFGGSPTSPTEGEKSSAKKSHKKRRSGSYLMDSGKLRRSGTYDKLDGPPLDPKQATL